MYLHSRKAGNRADVWKHFWLCEFVDRLPVNPAGPLTILDTHCGVGLFDRDRAEEWDNGIGRFVQSASDSLGKFGRIVAPFLARGEYLGSWALAGMVLAQRHVEFEILACDLSTDVEAAFRTNASNLGLTADCRFLRSNGYEVAAQGDPHTLVFLDPPYTPDPSEDWAALANLIPTLQNSAEAVAVWYPIHESSTPRQPSAFTNLPRHEITWGQTGMIGCGIAIHAKPPLDFSKAEHLAPKIAATLGGTYTKRVGQ